MEKALDEEVEETKHFEKKVGEKILVECVFGIRKGQWILGEIVSVEKTEKGSVIGVEFEGIDTTKAVTKFHLPA